MSALCRWRSLATPQTKMQDNLSRSEDLIIPAQVTAMSDVLRPKKYPGRDRVMARESARDILFNRNVREHQQADPYACLSPVILHGIGLPGITDPGKPLPVELHGRCRRCEHCLKHRRRLWAARAVDECGVAARTWFGTLTVSPENRVRLGYQAERDRLRASNETLGDLDADELYALLAATLGRDVTKWLKRVRDVAPGPLRYLAVFEAHIDGFPHVHILVHEVGPPITKRELERQWKLGFSHWRLLSDERGVGYVTKYLAKDMRTRVRASIRYGQAHQQRLLTERLRDASRTLSERVREQTAERNDGKNTPSQ